jgi:DNA repair protein RecO (recombination protein O)
MEIPKTTGIVLRYHPVTETSLIVIWLTKHFGKLRTMAKGARRPKSPFRGKVEPFYLDELLFLRSRRSDLHILHECSVLNPHRRLREDYQTISVATYFCELVDLATEPEHAEAKLFALLQATLDHLTKTGWQPLLAPYFEINLLAALGLDPARRRIILPPDLKKLIERLRELRLDELSRLRLSAQQFRALDSFFLAQAEQQFGRLPRSHRFVKL